MRTIVIADAHPGYRRALRGLAERDPTLSVVADVADLREAGDVTRRRNVDALVVDADLLEAGRAQLGPLPATTAIVVMGMDDSRWSAQRAVRDGAHAYVVKDDAHLSLPRVLRGWRGLSGAQGAAWGVAPAQDRPREPRAHGR